MHNRNGCNARHQSGRNAGRHVLGMPERRLPDEDVVFSMDHDFLDGIDEQFQRLMKASGNGKGNGRSGSHSNEDRLTSRIIDHLGGLSPAQKEEVLAYIRNLKQKVD
jgi:hypothetical protein